ncbi:MAG: hypothetical protein K5Q68_21795 [Roseococcus sp.]|nr:hypothetical protein [Roseococcus sp.]
MTIWLPFGLLAATLIIAEARKLTGAEGGWMGLALPLVFSASALWLLGLLFISVDLLAWAADTRQAFIAFDAEHMALNTAILAVLGFALGFGGAGRAAGLVAVPDPEAPMPSLFLPVFAALLGAVMVALAYTRL